MDVSNFPRRDVHTSSPSKNSKNNKKRSSLDDIQSKNMPSLPFSYPKKPHHRPKQHDFKSGNLSLLNISSPQSHRSTYSDASTQRTNEHPKGLSRSNSTSTVELNNHTSSPSTHRVKFSNSIRHSTNRRNSACVVVNLPWSDNHGASIQYTGQVSELMQPHGFGYAVYINGDVVRSVWCNGMPVKELDGEDARNYLDIGEMIQMQLKNESGEDNIMRRMSSLSSSSPEQQRVLELGDIATPFEMQSPLPISAYEANVFPVHSFACVLRSDGQWTYAIVADRPVLDGPEASIRFVVDKMGSTKVLKRKHWGKYIRLAIDCDEN